jgi:hypothetical protein
MEYKLCDCIKSDVCPHRYSIPQAFDKILEIKFGGRQKEIDILFALMRRYCKYRVKK